MCPKEIDFSCKIFYRLIETYLFQLDHRSTRDHAVYQKLKVQGPVGNSEKNGECYIVMKFNSLFIQKN